MHYLNTFTCISHTQQHWKLADFILKVKLFYTELHYY